VLHFLVFSGTDMYYLLIQVKGLYGLCLKTVLERFNTRVMSEGKGRSYLCRP